MSTVTFTVTINKVDGYYASIQVVPIDEVDNEEYQDFDSDADRAMAETEDDDLIKVQFIDGDVARLFVTRVLMDEAKYHQSMLEECLSNISNITNLAL